MAFTGKILIADGDHQGTHWEWKAMFQCVNCRRQGVQIINVKKIYFPAGIEQKDVEQMFEERVKENHVCRDRFGLPILNRRGEMDVNREQVTQLSKKPKFSAFQGKFPEKTDVIVPDGPRAARRRELREKGKLH